MYQTKIEIGLFLKMDMVYLSKILVFWAESSTWVQLSSALEMPALLVKLLWRWKSDNAAPMPKGYAVTQRSWGG